MDTKEILIPKGKGYDPTLTPGPNVSGTNQPKRYGRDRKPKKKNWLIHHFASVVIQLNCLVDVAQGLKSRRLAFEAQ